MDALDFLKKNTCFLCLIWMKPLVVKNESIHEIYFKFQVSDIHLPRNCETVRLFA